MAGYIGGKVAVSAPQQIETKHTITATASQTSIPNISYTVGAVHVYQNGIRLVDGTDYTATNGSTVTLETGATEGDQIVIVSHGSFETSDTVSKASGGTFAAAMNYPGGAVTGDVAFGDSNKILMGAGSDLQLYHNGSASYITDQGTGNLVLGAADSIIFQNAAHNENMLVASQNGAVSLYHDNAIKLATTATGIDVTGAITVGGAALGSGGMEFISSTDVSNAATASFTGFDSSKYDSYLFTLANIVPATDGAVFGVRMSVDTGSNYLSASDSYRQISAEGISAGDANLIPLMYYGFGNVSTEGGSMDVKVNGPHLNTRTYAKVFGHINADTSDNIQASNSGGGTKVATVVDAIQFLFASGNIASGTITMYGMVNS